MTAHKNPFFCQCGMKFRSYTAEARHRHNFPLLCKTTKTDEQKGVVTGRFVSDTPNFEEVEKTK